MFRRIFILTILLTGLCNLNVFSQKISLETTPQTQEILKRFSERFTVMDSVIFRNSNANYYSGMSDSVFYLFPEAVRVKEVDDAVDAQIRSMRSVNGVELRGQTYFRPGKGLNYDPDDPLVAYNAKFQVELQWDPFGSSLYKRTPKTRELELQGELRQLDYVRDDLDQQILIQKQIVRYQYYSYLLSVIRLHAENVQLLLDTQFYLLEHGKISGDDLLKLINEQSELDRQLVAIKADSVINEIPAPISAAYIEYTDTAGILRSIKTNTNNLEIRKLGLRFDILEAQKNKLDYLQTMNLQPFARFSYYNRPYAHNTYNVDLGVSFNIPISKQVSKKQKALMAEQDVVLYERQVLETETSKGIYLAFHDLEIYNENIKGEYKRMQNLKRFLEGRTHSFGKVSGEYSRIERLMEYNAYLQAWERLLDYAYQRDLVLIQLQSYLLYEPISTYIRFVELK